MARLRIDRNQLIVSLYDVRDDIRHADPNLKEVDIRLQAYISPDSGETWWQVKWGDSSFDLDHRGHWGASSISPGYNSEDLRTLADDLLAQVEESAAQSEETLPGGG